MFRLVALATTYWLSITAGAYIQPTPTLAGGRIVLFL
jgi:hypothetical protein